MNDRHFEDLRRSAMRKLITSIIHHLYTTIYQIQEARKR